MEPLFLLSRTINIESTIAKIAVAIIAFAIIAVINSIRKGMKKNSKIQSGKGSPDAVPSRQNASVDKVLKNQELLEQMDGKSDSDAPKK